MLSNYISLLYTAITNLISTKEEKSGNLYCMCIYVYVRIYIIMYLSMAIDKIMHNYVSQLLTFCIVRLSNFAHTFLHPRFHFKTY